MTASEETSRDLIAARRVIAEQARIIQALLKQLARKEERS